MISAINLKDNKMSKEFLTRRQCGLKIGGTPPGPDYDEFVTKEILTNRWGGGNIDLSKLTGYSASDFVVDDDIVLKEIVPTGKHLSGTMVPGVWNYSPGVRYGYYSGQGGSYTITVNEVKTVTILGCLMIAQEGAGFWGPIFHGDAGKVYNVNRMALTFSFFNGHYMKGIVKNDGSEWWSFCDFKNQDDWKQKMVDGMAANKGKQITWDIIFWNE